MERNEGSIKQKVTASLAVLLVLHFIFSTLEYYYNYISGDFTKETALGIIFYVMNALTVVLVYFRFGIVICAYRNYTKKNALPFAIVCAISLLLSHFLEVLVFALGYSDFSVSPMPYILSALLSFLCDIIITVIIILLTQLKKLKNSKLIFTAVICAALYLATVLTQTVYYTDFSALDSTVVLLDYVRPVVCAALGVFVILTTNKILFAKREKNEE